VVLSTTVLEELKRHRLAQCEELLNIGIRPGGESFVVAQVNGKPLKPVSPLMSGRGCRQIPVCPASASMTFGILMPRSCSRLGSIRR
jgi:hypothetical protein